MRLQELKKKEMSEVDEVKGRVVTIFLQAFFHRLSGEWFWDMTTDAVFCSDVMLSLPPDFIGTRGIFHPDDLELVKQKATLDIGHIDHLEFRIITTYGEVKSIVGRNITIDKAEDSLEAWPQQIVKTAIQEVEQLAAHHHLRLLHQIHLNTEHFTGSGIWYYNTASGLTWYSDFIFRMHHLPPQSLNAHLNTFLQFVHPEDTQLYIDFTEKALAEQTPLYFEYRIVVNGTEKFIAYKSQWLYSEKGENIVCGTLQDISEQKLAEEQAEAQKNLLQFQKQQQAFDEQHAGIGHWRIDLLSRKTIYSDNFYRIFGLKPGSLTATIHSFINFVHPDDREMVTAANKKLVYEHTVPDMEYRIVRPDGKTRYISQKAKLLTYEKEMIASGIIHDITVQKLLEKKINALHEESVRHKLEQLQVQEMAGIGSWLMDLDDETIVWSEGFYKLLGYRGPAPEMSPKSLFSFLHPHDLKQFKDHWSLAIKLKQESAFSFRFLIRGTERHMRAVFHIKQDKQNEFFIGTLQDITLETVLQDQLANRVQLAESLSENISDRVLITDADNIIILWNRACEKSYGLKAEEAVGQNFFDVFPRLRTEDETQMFHQVLKGESVTRQALFSLSGNGYFDLFLVPLWKGDLVTGILHIAHDVTKEVELQNNLLERIHLIEGLLESSVDRIIALDRNLNYIYWNRQSEKYYGLSKKKTIGKNILEVFPQIRNDPSFSEFRRALRGDTVYLPGNYETGKNFETYLVPVKGENGEVISILWMAHDLSKEYELLKEREASQQVIEEEHRRLKEAQAIGHVGSFEWNAANDAIYWSDEMYRIHGLEPQSEEITLERVLSFIYPEDVTGSAEKLLRCRKEPCSLTIVHRIQRTDGEVRFVSRQLKSFADAEGRVTHLTGTLQDITEEKKGAEKLREQSHYLKRIQDTVPDMISILNLESGDFEYLNAETFKAHGFDPDEMKAQTREQRISYIHPDDRKPLAEYFGKFATALDEDIITVEYRAKANSNEWQWFLVRGRVFQRNDEGKTTHVLNVIENITARKTSEKAIKEQSHFIETITNVMPHIVTVIEYPSKKILYSNRTTMTSLGFDVDEIVNMSFDKRVKLFHPDDVAVITAFYDRFHSFRDDEENYMEYRLKNKKGEWIWLAIRGKVFQRDEKGDITQVLMIGQNITEQKKADEISKNNLTILHHAEELAQIGNWEYEIATGKFNWSKGMYQLLGIPQQLQVRPETYLDVALKEDRPIAKRIVNYLKNKPLSFEETLRIQRGDEKRLLRIKASVVKDEKGIAQKVVGVDLDITDIWQAEEKIRETQHWLHQTAQASPDAITVYNLVKKQPVYLNNCLSEWTVKTLEELVDMGIEGRLQLIHPDDRLPLLHFNEKMATSKEGDMLTIEYRLRSKDDQERWIRNRSKVFLRDASGTVTHILSILQDVSEEKAAERLLKSLNTSLEKQNRELENKNDEITSFAFVASHDLREPLRKIHTFGDWLLQKEEHLSEAGKQTLKRLNNSVQRLDTLVEDIVALTKVHIEKEDLRDVNLEHILHRSKQEMQELLEKSGAKIISGSLPVVKALENQLVYLFRNLFSNSIKFQPPGNPPVIQITATREDEFVKLVFTDNGIGFSPEFSKRIFQMFRRLHGKNEYEGTGMGLAICKRIMEKHGGNITAQSEPGKGSSFTCWFPV